MRKLIVLFFLFLYLFSSTEFSELLKVNVLIEHFAEHKIETKTLSFSQFLYMHYIKHGKDNGDGNKDDKLPFHSDSETVNSFISVPLPCVPFSISFIHILKNDKKVNFYDVDKTITSSFLSTIWQPPQIV
jgi:hypothetical protein